MNRPLQILYLFLFLLSAVAIGDALGNRFGLPVQVDFLFGFCLVWALTWPITAVHEFGHASVAWMAGWRTPVISIRSLTIWTRPLRVRWGAPAFPGVSGAVFIVPPDGKRRESWKASYMAILSAGSVANLIFSFALFFVASKFKLQSLETRMLFVTGFLSAFIGLANLIPARLGREPRNDSAMFFDARKPQRLQSFESVVRLAEEMIAGKRPRDWNHDRLLKLQQEADAGLSSAGGDMMLYDCAIDRRDFSSAIASLNRAWKKFGEPELLRIEYAFILAFSGRNVADAKAWLDTVQSRNLKKSFRYWRAESAVCAARQDRPGAEFALRRTRAILKRTPLATTDDHEILNEIESRLKPTSTNDTFCVSA